GRISPRRPDKTRQASHPASAPRHWRMRRERLIRPTCTPVGRISPRRPDKTRQASHPALPPGVFFLNPITNPAFPFSLFSGDG
ncbi:hypothetical protein, partial [Escherichia marmotae]|uniref:hypothetical protein n=1 Tax=Escherichia marmotae TaxID=1499973 RepID=UPI002F307B63